MPHEALQGAATCVFNSAFCTHVKPTKEALSPKGTAGKNDIIAPSVGLRRAGIKGVCVCFCMTVYVTHYHFSHEKSQKHTQSALIAVAFLFR